MPGKQKNLKREKDTHEILEARLGAALIAESSKALPLTAHCIWAFLRFESSLSSMWKSCLSEKSYERWNSLQLPNKIPFVYANLTPS